MLERLLKNLNSRKAAVREAALQEARALPPEQLLQLVERQAEICRLRRRRILLLSVNVFFVQFTAYLSMVLLDFHLLPRIIRPTFFSIAGGLMAFYLVRGIYIMNGPSRAIRELLSLIEEQEDINFLVPLLEFCYGERQTISPTLRNGILRLLPQLRLEQVPTWTSGQKSALLLPLKRPFADEKVIISVLKALEQVGGAEALPAVRKLTVTQIYDFGMEAHEAYRVQQAARDCLPYLEARAEQTGESQMLLRASDAVPKAGPEVLLRPAAQNTDTILSEQLLRPTTTEE